MSDDIHDAEAEPAVLRGGPNDGERCEAGTTQQHCERAVTIDPVTGLVQWTDYHRTGERAADGAVVFEYVERSGS